MMAHSLAIRPNLDCTNMLCPLPKLNKPHPLWRADIHIYHWLLIIDSYLVSLQILLGNLDKISRRKSPVLRGLNLELAPLCPLLVGRSVRAASGAESDK